MRTSAWATLPLLAASGLSQAADFPTKPARIVVPIGAGSSMDIVGRVLAQKFTEVWGQTVIVDNRAGAGGNIGADLVAKSAPDGYTVLFASSSFAIAPAYYRKLPYDALRDFEPVTQLSSRNNAVSVSPSSPVNSIKDLIALAKAKPGILTFGSGGGSGSSDQMAGELFKLLAGVDIAHVPYKGAALAITDLIGGRRSIIFTTPVTAQPLIKGGKLKTLAVAGDRRLNIYPDVPTTVEQGLKGFDVLIWFGVSVPAGTPRPVVFKLNRDLQRLLQFADVQERFATLGLDPQGGSPERFATIIKEDIERWRTVVKEARIED